MNKREFEHLFKTVIEPDIPKDDKPALREAWNNTIDGYIKDRILPEKAANWVHPKRFYLPSERK